jgi:hypothetical protein
MAGAHIHWRKRAFRARWILCGAPGCTGSIAAVRDAPDATTAYAWSVHCGPAGTPDAVGVAATLSDARLLASRAVFAALPTPAVHPAPGPAWARQASAKR